MPHTFSHFHSQLIKRILVAASQEEVMSIIDATMKEVEHQEKEILVPFYFAGKIITELELYSPMKKDAQQWSNIQMARVHLHRIRSGMKENAA